MSTLHQGLESASIRRTNSEPCHFTWTEGMPLRKNESYCYQCVSWKEKAPLPDELRVKGKKVKLSL
jgi:hypothetical protein